MNFGDLFLNSKNRQLMPFAGFALAIGFGAAPSFDGDAPVDPLAPVLASFLWFAFLSGPYLPLAAALAACAAKPQWPHGVVLALIVLTGLVGAATGVIAFLGGRPSLWIAHVAVFSALIGIALCLLQETSPIKSLRARGAAMLALAILASVWSVGVGVRAFLQAQHIANGQPYCVGYHGLNQPIRSLSDLRGGWLWTGHDGYKIGDQWYFDAVLITERGEIFNWSHSRMRFDRLRGSPSEINRRFLGRGVSEVCRPAPDFLKRLPLL